MPDQKTTNKTSVNHSILPNKSGIEYFFRNNRQYDPCKDMLLNTRSSQRWFSELKKCIDDDTYIFQKAFDKKSGPVSSIENREIQVFSSYDYLGLIGHKEIEQTAIESISKYGTGTGGVRLLTGTNCLHEELEAEISRFKKTEAAMTFSSGYLANFAAITGLMDPRDLVIIDQNIHKSINEALKTAGVTCKYFKHNNTSHLREKLENNRDARRVFIIVEGIYSMDGDICPLDEIIELKKKFSAFLILDEAHSLGVLGKNGRGADEHFSIDPGDVDIFTGSLSKAIPSNGGFLAARKEVIHFLKHGGAPFMFSAALTPASTAAALAAIKVLEKESWRIQKLWENSSYMLNSLKTLPVDTGQSVTPIIPIITGSNNSAFGLSSRLYDRGYLATSVIYPAVPADMARLRLCCTANHTQEMIRNFISDLSCCLD